MRRPWWGGTLEAMKSVSVEAYTSVGCTPQASCIQTRASSVSTSLLTPTMRGRIWRRPSSCSWASSAAMLAYPRSASGS